MAVALQKVRPATLAGMQLVEGRNELQVPNHLLETSE